MSRALNALFASAREWALPSAVTRHTPHRRAIVSVWLAFTIAIICGPLTGWPGTLRGSVVLGVPLLLTWLLIKPWTWEPADWVQVASFAPRGRHVAVGAVLSALVLLWIVITLFQGGHINGVDFTIYFDRPLYQTAHGRPVYVETTDDATFEYLTHLGVHAYWLLLPLSTLYLLQPSPYWLLVLSVVAAVAGSVYVLRIGRAAGLGGVMSCAAAGAVLLNDNTARTLRYGFHPEVMYLWFVPWMIDAALQRRRRAFLTALFLTVLVKEDAIFPVCAAVSVVGLLCGRSMTGRERLLYLALPVLVAVVNLALFYSVVVPALWPHPGMPHANFWANYGDTPLQVVAGMAQHPWSVLRDVLTSGLLTVVLPPFLFLPLVGWRYSIGTLPLVAVFGASANDQVRAFGIYYAVYLVPFFALATAAGARTLAGLVLPAHKVSPIAAAIVVVAALVVGPGYALRPWRAEVAAVPAAIAALSEEPVVLVQSGLYPHAGYEARVQLLTPRALGQPRNNGAALLVAPGIRAYPFSDAEIDALTRLPSVGPMPGGLLAVRLSQDSDLTEAVTPSERVEGASEPEIDGGDRDSRR